MLRRKWKLHQIGKYRDTEWLETICNSDGYNSWVNYTSDRSQKIMSLLELNTVFSNQAKAGLCISNPISLHENNKKHCKPS